MPIKLLSTLACGEVNIVPPRFDKVTVRASLHSVEEVDIKPTATGKNRIRSIVWKLEERLTETLFGNSDAVPRTLSAGQKLVDKQFYNINDPEDVEGLGGHCKRIICALRGLPPNATAEQVGAPDFVEEDLGKEALLYLTYTPSRNPSDLSGGFQNIAAKPLPAAK